MEDINTQPSYGYRKTFKKLNLNSCTCVIIEMWGKAIKSIKSSKHKTRDIRIKIWMKQNKSTSLKSEINAFIFQTVPLFSMSAAEYLITVIIKLYWKHLKYNLRVLFFNVNIYTMQGMTSLKVLRYMLNTFSCLLKMYRCIYTLRKFFQGCSSKSTSRLFYKLQLLMVIFYHAYYS